MRDRDLYRRILGIEWPWEVVDVELKLDDGEVLVWIEHAASEQLRCPECGEAVPGYDKRSRRWRHLDTCQYRTILAAKVPRVECPEHGVRQVRVPWGEPGSRFTALFEALIIDWLAEASTAAVARLFDLSWEAVDGVMQRAVRRGLERRDRSLPSHIGVDETSFQKRHEYVTVVVDQDRDTVEYIADGRGRETLDEFFAGFSTEELAGVESIAIDMWAPYVSSIVGSVPDAARKIAFDKFHLAMHLNRAVDEVRRAEHRELIAEGREELKGTKYLWLKSPERLRGQQALRFEALRQQSLKTSRAWAIKDLAMKLWDFTDRGQARSAWSAWYSWAIRSQLEPIKRVARMVRDHLEGIVNAIVLRVTNARTEAINATIQWLKYTARGFRNRERFRTAIYFHLGGLDLYPETLDS